MLFEEIDLLVIKMNGCTKYLGLEKLETIFRSLTSLSDKQLLSVGSGLGTIEKHIENKIGTNFICIDPAPRSWQHTYPGLLEEEHMPEYPLVPDLVGTKPELVKNCNLFLGFCTPNQTAGNYDMHAIFDLRPECIVVSCESSGSAGSTLFLTWLKMLADKQAMWTGEFSWVGRMNTAEHPKLDEFASNYSIVSYYTCKLEAMGGPFHYKYVLIKRKDVKMTEDFEKIEHADEIYNPDGGCVMM